MKIDSNSLLIYRPVEEVYNFIQDFRNFGQFLPQQAKNYTADYDSCSFEISGMGCFRLIMQERIENLRLVAVSDNNSPISFSLSINLASEQNGNSKVHVSLDAVISSFLAMIAKNPLSNFVNLLSEKIKEIMEAGNPVEVESEGKG